MSAFVMDDATGALTPFSGSPFPAGAPIGGLALSAGRHFMFGFTNGLCCDPSEGPANLIRAQISASGQLSAFSGDLLPATFAAGGVFPTQRVIAAVHPTRDFVYRFDQNQLWASSFDESGNLSSEQLAYTFPLRDGCASTYEPLGFVAGTPEPSLIVVNYSFVTSCNSSPISILTLKKDGTGDTFSALATGTFLNLGANGSYAVATVATLTSPTSETGNTTLYQVIGGQATALATCDGSITFPCTQFQRAVVTSDGRMAFASDDMEAGNIWTLRREGNVLTPVKNALAPTDRANTMALSLDERFLLVAQIQASSIAVYAIGTDGSLTPVPGSPFATGVLPAGIVVLER